MDNWQEKDADRKARQIARAVADREQGRRRLNAATVTVAAASVAVAGVVVAVLPGSSHAAVQGNGGTSNSSPSTGSAGSTSGSDGSSSPSNDQNGVQAPAQNGFQQPANPPQVVTGGGANATSGGT